MVGRLNRNERKLLLLASNNDNKLEVIANMFSAAICVKCKDKKCSPEYFFAIQGLARKKYLKFTGFDEGKKELRLEYALTALGIEKIKLLNATNKNR